MTNFDEDLATARELLDDDDLDGFFAAVVRDDEFDYAFAHEFTDPETTGMQALTLLAAHVNAVAGEAGVDPEQVAADAASLAARLGE